LCDKIIIIAILTAFNWRQSCTVTIIFIRKQHKVVAKQHA